MSNDTAECGCEGHVENFDACKYPALLERVRRLEEALTEVDGWFSTSVYMDDMPMGLDERVKAALKL